MEIRIDIVALVAIITAILGCFGWVSHKLDSIKDAICKLDKNSVTHDICSAHRENCPCVKSWERVNEHLIKTEDRQ